MSANFSRCCCASFLRPAVDLPRRGAAHTPASRHSLCPDNRVHLIEQSFSIKTLTGWPRRRYSRAYERRIPQSQDAEGRKKNLARAGVFIWLRESVTHGSPASLGKMAAAFAFAQAAEGGMIVSDQQKIRARSQGMSKGGRPAIKDRFTKLRVSRQRKYQLRHRAKGKCEKCYAARFCKSTLCAAHLVRQRKSTRKRTGYKRWKPGSPGAVPWEARK